LESGGKGHVDGFSKVTARLTYIGYWFASVAAGGEPTMAKRLGMKEDVSKL
jgi:hypothetical protein